MKTSNSLFFRYRHLALALAASGILAGNTPAAVAFAVIRDAECIYRGVVTQSGIFPGLPPTRRSTNEDLIEAGLDMPATIDTWRQVLHQLMASFLAGDAAIELLDSYRPTVDDPHELAAVYADIRRRISKSPEILVHNKLWPGLETTGSLNSYFLGFQMQAAKAAGAAGAAGQ